MGHLFRKVFDGTSVPYAKSEAILYCQYLAVKFLELGEGAHEGRPYVGVCGRGGMGPRIREDTGGRVCYDDEILHSASLRSE